MKKAVLYARVSSSLQEKERTIESQIEELKKQIKSADHVLVKEYLDDGYSGAMLSRPGMDQLREDIKTNLFDTIYFHNTDRIARDVTYQNIIIGEILRHKKQIIINGVDYINNPENKFTLTVLGAVAELEKTKILERSMRGRQHRLKQGQLLSHGNNIYGYTYIHKTDQSSPSYVINQAEAKIVNYVFELYSMGNISYRELVRNLENKNIPPRQGRIWNWYQIRVMLRNQTYTGIKYFNTTTDTNALGKYESRIKKIQRVATDRSTWIGIKIPQIISESLFDKVQNRINHSMVCYRNVKETKLLSNLVWCGKCQKRCHSYHRNYKVERKDGKKLYQRTIYRCGAAAGGHNPEINGGILEPCVLKMIKTYFFDPNKLKTCMTYFSNHATDKQTEVELKIKEIKSKIKVIQKQKERIVDLYSLGDLERETYIEKVNSYEKEVNSLEKQSKELARSRPVFNNPKELELSIIKYCKEAKQKFNESKPRQFILAYVNKIEYTHHNGVDDVSLCGSANNLSFIIKDKINRKESLKQLL